MRKQCSYCNQDSLWQLCVMRTWFTLFFIPVIPYKTVYCITCPNCGSYLEIEREYFKELKEELKTNKEQPNIYAGKTETQIQYLKAMEEQDKA